MATRAGAAEIFEEVADDMSWNKAKQISLLLEFVEEQDLAGELQDYLEEVVEGLRADDEEEEDDDREDVDIDLFSNED